MSFFHILFGILIAAIWGLNFVAIKISYQTFTPFILILVRFVMTSIPLIFFVPRPKSSWKYIIGLALFQWIGQFVPLFLAIHQGMSPGLTSMILQAQVLITTLLSVIIYQSSLSDTH